MDLENTRDCTEWIGSKPLLKLFSPMMEQLYRSYLKKLVIMLYWIKDPCFNKSLITVIFHLIWQILSKLRISELESAIKNMPVSHSVQDHTS